ncbi:Cytidylate kinase [Azospirillaceae bacterium]
MTVIAVDGPAASGKGTLARRIASFLSFSYLDTGLLYRAIGWSVIQIGGDPSDESCVLRCAEKINLDEALFQNPHLRGEDVAIAASKAAAISNVRTFLLEYQRVFAYNPPKPYIGAVLDGRDVGTVVCPEADAKIFITARLDVRAKRRWLELCNQDPKVSFLRVLDEMKSRDERDSHRGVAPLIAAKDAYFLDATDYDIETTYKMSLDFLQSKGIFKK